MPAVGVTDGRHFAFIRFAKHYIEQVFLFKRRKKGGWKCFEAAPNALPQIT